MLDTEIPIQACATPAGRARRASPPATRWGHVVAARCCPPADARARSRTAAAASPASRPGGSGWNGRAPAGRDRAGGGRSRSALPFVAGPGGTRPATSRPWRSPGPNTRAARPGWSAARPATPRAPRPRTSRDVVAAVLVRFERHGGRPCRSRRRPQASLPQGARPGDPCNKVNQRSSARRSHLHQTAPTDPNARPGPGGMRQSAAVSHSSPAAWTRSRRHRSSP